MQPKLSDFDLSEMSKVNFKGPHDLNDLTVLQIKERENNVIFNAGERPHQSDAFTKRPDRPEYDPTSMTDLNGNKNPPGRRKRST